MAVPQVGRVGVWSMELRFGDPAEIAAAAAEIEDLGFGAIWIPGGFGGDILEAMRRLLDATRRVTVASGIINVWKHEPAELADWWHALPDGLKARTLLGLGVSHGPAIGEAWAKPLAVMRDYVERVTAAGIPADNLCLAALGPKMIALSGERTAGAHPYLGTPGHNREARAILGPGKLLAPEQGVVLEGDPGTARALARDALELYMGLPNYRNNWLRLGLTEDEIESRSDKLIDALFAWGEPARIAERVAAHFAGGADHVCLQVIKPKEAGFDRLRKDWRTLAGALL